MKRITLTFLIAFICSAVATAQVCTSGNFTVPGIYPSDTAAGLKKACVNTPYSETITVVVASSIDVDGTVYQISSLKINSITGLPSGITYGCNPSNCTIPGGSKGCVGFSGTTPIIGSFPLTAAVTINFRVGFFTVPFDTSLGIGNLVVQPKDCAGVCGGAATTQTIPLALGWNMISAYVAPPNPSMPVVFQAIASNIALVKNNAGNSYIPQYNINTIGNWDNTQGYKVKTIAATQLVIGCSQPFTSSIHLNAGWNIISYLKSTPSNVETVFSSIKDDLIMVKNSAGNSYIPSIPVNTIGNMQPGQGYQVKMLRAVTLTYPVN